MLRVFQRLGLGRLVSAAAPRSSADTNRSPAGASTKHTPEEVEGAEEVEEVEEEIEEIKVSSYQELKDLAAKHGEFLPDGGVLVPHDGHHDHGNFFQNPHPHHHVEVTEEVPDVVYGPFGTIDNPAIVKSAFAERIVGCLGRSSENGHVLLWHNVNNKKPTICVECGQVFKLKTVGIPSHDEHHTHHATADHGAHASGAHASGAHASGAHASEAHASGAHASGAHASGAHASGAHASGAHASGAHASGAHASGAHGEMHATKH